LPSTVYFTPAGNAIGFLPIRDIAYSLSGLRVLELAVQAILFRQFNSTAALKAFALIYKAQQLPF